MWFYSKWKGNVVGVVKPPEVCSMKEFKKLHKTSRRFPPTCVNPIQTFNGPSSRILIYLRQEKKKISGSLLLWVVLIRFPAQRHLSLRTRWSVEKRTNHVMFIHISCFRYINERASENFHSGTKDFLVFKKFETIKSLRLCLSRSACWRNSRKGKTFKCQICFAFNMPINARAAPNVRSEMWV